MQRLPGIINIYYVLASSLMASITQKALADAPVGVFADTFLIRISVMPFVKWRRSLTITILWKR